MWCLYSDAFLKQLPAICRADPEVWRAKVLLICQDIIEMHHPNRVMQQFGIQKNILSFLVLVESLEGKKPAQRWILYAVYTSQWSYRLNFVVHKQLELLQTDEFLIWYIAVTQGPIYSYNAPPAHYELKSVIEHELITSIVIKFQICFRQCIFYKSNC